jgi:hypothetical protein
MSLDLSALAPQLSEAGASAAEALERRRQLLPEAERAFDSLASMDSAEIQEKLKAAGESWHGAKPTVEAVNATYAPKPIHGRYQMLAADGSQIYPDRHAAVHYFLINTGSISLEPGSGQAPSVRSHPRLFHKPEELYNEQGSPLGNELINGERDVAEMAELAQLATDSSEVRSLALLDNGLLLWLALQVRDQPKQREADLIERYLSCLSQLEGASAALAGVIDRPRHSSLLALAHLGQLPLAAIDDSAHPTNTFRGLNDASLMLGRLEPGERSALFATAPGHQSFHQAGHDIYFFYLRTAAAGLLRVEVPQWVAQDADQLALVHAGIVEDSKASAGYPYTLARAHELAVVTSTEKRRLDELMVRELARHGMDAAPSNKATMKTWLGGRRRHRL